MTDSVKSHSDDFIIVSVPPKGSSYQNALYKRQKILQESEKKSWLGIDINSIGKPGTKGSFCPSYLQSFEKRMQRYLRGFFTEDTRPALVSFLPITEDQLTKEPISSSMYTKGGIYQTKDLLYRIFKTDSRLVRSILENSGFASTDSHDWNLLWVGSSAQMYLYEGLNEYQRINHFPNSYELTRKDKFHSNLSKMAQLYGTDDFDFVPETYLLPDQYNEFYAQYLKQKQSMWIHKPCGSSQGRGIFLINSPSDIPPTEPCIVSKYISNPLLINELKFDVRIYVLVSSFDPLRIYVYDEGLTRFACEKYAPGNRNNRFSHLTNYSVNKKNEKFVQNQDWKQDNIGHKWSLSALNKVLESMGVDTTLIWMKIYDLIIKSIISIEPIVLESLRNLVVHRNSCFDLFGFDVLIDSDLKPWLLEVNLSPSLATDSPLDLHIKSELISDTFNLINVRAFDRKKESANKVRARIKARQIQLDRERKKFGDMFVSISDGRIGKSAELFRDTLEEYEHKGGFLRIYPAKGCDHYDRFFSGLRPSSKLLYRFLFYDIWETELPVTVAKDPVKGKTEEKPQCPFDELLFEYSSRLAHALKTLPEDNLRQDWRINIENFLNHSYWTGQLKVAGSLWQSIETRMTEIKKRVDERKVEAFRSLSAIKLELNLKAIGKNTQLELVNTLFVDEKTGILSDIIKWLSLKAQKRLSHLSVRRTKEEDSSVDGSMLYSSCSPVPTGRPSHRKK